MEYKYQLSDIWTKKVNNLEEFRNGATQVSIKLKNGKVEKEILISDSQYIVAMRNHTDLNFSIDDIEDIYQSEDDKNPKNKGGWDYWDNWK